MKKKMSVAKFFSMELLLSLGAFLQRNLIRESSHFSFDYVIH